MSRTLLPIALLFISNAFMTFAWYGHLKFTNKALWVVILASWGIALFEYMFAVPANHIGSERFTLTQLKIMQECISLTVFLGIAALFFRQPIKWNTVVSMFFIVVAVFFAFLGTDKH